MGLAHTKNDSWNLYRDSDGLCPLLLTGFNFNTSMDK